MEFERFDNFMENDTEDNLNLRDVILPYLVQWKWYIISVLISGSIAFLLLRNEAPKFQSSAKILIKDLGKGSSVADLSSFEDLGLISASDNSLENEIHILTSRRLIQKVVKELNLNQRFFIEKRPYNREIFPNFPFLLDFEEELNDQILMENDSVNYDELSLKNKKIYTTNASFKVSVLSNEKYEFFNEEEESLGVKNFNEFIETDFGKIRISLNESFNNDLRGKIILVSIGHIVPVSDSYLNRILVEPIDEKSRVVSISIRGQVVNKGIAIVNNLIDQYNADAVEDKNQVHLNTINFLNERIELLTSQLSAIEITAEQFKTKNRMVDESSGSAFLISSSENENDLIVANTQLQLAVYMLNELNDNEIGVTLPVNIGLSDVSITAITRDYNELVLTRNRILKSSSTRNPTIVAIDSQLNELKSNLIISLNNLKNSIEIRINSLADQSDKIDYRIASVPKNEREFKEIVRQQETKNVLYLFLLQKREESILSKSVNVDRAKIVDSAYSNRRPVSPKKKVTYMASILIGLLIPTLLIYLSEFLDTKVHGEKDISKLKIPIIGDIPETKLKKKRLIQNEDNSILAEAYRYIRTNLGFMLDKKPYGKVIFITSTLKGEGKTLSAINLASSLASSGKKTLLLGMDLRAPKISNYLELEDKIGVSNYIKNDDLKIEHLIVGNSKIKNLDLINSGNIPPNPVELLMSKRVEELFKSAEKLYEYIIVDTAPVGLVTDTIQISSFADLTLYVIKDNFLDKRMLHIPEKLNREGRLKNMSILINGTDLSKEAYGYGYGYGNDKKKRWFG